MATLFLCSCGWVLFNYFLYLNKKNMKIKILKSNNKSTWYNNSIDHTINVYYDIKYSKRCFGGHNGSHCLFNDDVVITELPELFCVKRCDDEVKWGKYIQWLNKTYKNDFIGNGVKLYYGLNEGGGWYAHMPFGTEIHIDDVIKHIDYMENKEDEFDMTTNEGRLAYAAKNYPIGTRYIPLDAVGAEYITYRYDLKNIMSSNFAPELWEGEMGKGIEVSNTGLVYHEGTNKWAEIIKEEVKEINMETQKLTRAGLKEIHSVACSNWKGKLEGMGIRNPLEDYIELTQEEVDAMFKACTKEQLPIVSKYLKQDDGSVDVSKVTYNENGTLLNDIYIVRHNAITSITNGFWLNADFNWEVKMISDTPFLVPTKKK